MAIEMEVAARWHRDLLGMEGGQQILLPPPERYVKTEDRAVPPNLDRC